MSERFEFFRPVHRDSAHTILVDLEQISRQPPFEGVAVLATLEQDMTYKRITIRSSDGGYQGDATKILASQNNPDGIQFDFRLGYWVSGQVRQALIDNLKRTFNYTPGGE